MINQKFLNFSTKSEVNAKFIIILIIASFLIVGGLFAYDHWWGYKATLRKMEEKKTSEMKAFEVPFWEGKEVIEEIKK